MLSVGKLKNVKFTSFRDDWWKKLGVTFPSRLFRIVVLLSYLFPVFSYHNGVRGVS